MSLWNNGNVSDFKPIPEGIYLAKIANVTCDLKTDKVRISIQYKLENNRRLFQNFIVTENGMKFIIWQFGILGLNDKAKELCPLGDSAENIAKAYVDASKDIIGEMVELEVKLEEYNNKIHERVMLVQLFGSADKTTEKTKEQNNAPALDKEEKLPF